MAISRADFLSFISELVTRNPNLGIPPREDGFFANLLIFEYLYHMCCSGKEKGRRKGKKKGIGWWLLAGFLGAPGKDMRGGPWSDVQICADLISPITLHSEDNKFLPRAPQPLLDKASTEDSQARESDENIVRRSFAILRKDLASWLHPRVSRMLCGSE